MLDGKSRFKIFAGILVLLVIFGYCAGFVGGVLVFVMFFPITVIAFLVLAYLVIFFVVKNVILKLSPDSLNKAKMPWAAVNKIAGLVTLLILIVLVVNIFSEPIVGEEGGKNFALKSLKTLPYVAWAPSKRTMGKSGVTIYDAEKAFDGINLYSSVDGPGVHLIDMKGNSLHTWPAQRTGHEWHTTAVLRKNGDLLAIVKSRKLICVDWNSNVKWVNNMRHHHEIAIGDDDDIYVLARKDEMFFLYGLPVPLLNDHIIILSSEGKIKREISLFKSAKGKLSLRTVAKIYRWMIKPSSIREMLKNKKEEDYVCKHGSVFDVFHNNTITIMDRKIEGLCNKGEILLCNRELDLVGVMGLETEEFVWTWGQGHLSRPHHPTLLENGNILIFDNGRIRKYSRIIELDPIAKKIVWEYMARPVQNFYSAIMGSSQRLPNGNTLITESSKCRVFEVTNDGEIVWEFYNPDVDKEKKRRAIIYRMTRITNSEDYRCLKELMN